MFKKITTYRNLKIKLHLIAHLLNHFVWKQYDRHHKNNDTVPENLLFKTLFLKVFHSNVSHHSVLSSKIPLAHYNIVDNGLIVVKYFFAKSI